MQWVILTPLTMLFLFIVVPAFLTGIRGLRVIKLAPKGRRSPVGDHQRADGTAGQDRAAQATEAGLGEAGGSSGTESLGRVLPGKGWLIALGLLALYLLAPFVLAPLFGLLMDD